MQLISNLGKKKLSSVETMCGRASVGSMEKKNVEFKRWDMRLCLKYTGSQLMRIEKERFNPLGKHVQGGQWVPGNTGSCEHP